MDSLLAENDRPAVVATALTEALPAVALQNIPLAQAYPRPPIAGLAFGHRSPLEKKYNRIVKRLFDILFAFLLIIAVLSWMIPIFFILVKLDSKGPVFFRQRRNCEGGKLFWCIKFRTMIVNKEADLVAAAKDDERITRSGKFLRRYHLDEFPQLLNVLVGEMSVIGPRPYMLSENLRNRQTLQDCAYEYRHSIKPGITGLAQSFGNVGTPGNLSQLQERTRLDIQYIRQWSIGMDIKILYRTFMSIMGVPVELRTEGPAT